ncbi:MAG: VOC family protein [Anaerolineales bacterium]|nr:VOC family protein [Anaerolineales bacterium]
MSKFKVQQIDHVELFVPDRYEAAQWYQEVLGLEIIPEFEFWAEDENGPLMISSDGGSTKLALFKGEPQGSRIATGHKRVAFRISGAGIMEFISRLKTHNIIGGSGEPLTAGDVVDHEKSFSIYFVDPYGYNYEITTYDYAFVAARL